MTLAHFAERLTTILDSFRELDVAGQAMKRLLLTLAGEMKAADRPFVVMEASEAAKAELKALLQKTIDEAKPRFDVAWPADWRHQYEGTFGSIPEDLAALKERVNRDTIGPAPTPPSPADLMAERRGRIYRVSLWEFNDLDLADADPIDAVVFSPTLAGLRPGLHVEKVEHNVGGQYILVTCYHRLFDPVPLGARLPLCDTHGPRPGR